VTAATGLDRELVGPYRLIAAIGAGGSARIDLARIDRAYNFQRHVVIKRPLEHLRADKAVAASLQREARIGGRLRHPNLVAVLDAGVHDGYDYLALEYIHGSSLRTLMQTETGGQVRDLPLAVSLGIAIDIARGMHDAHELADTDRTPLGLVHRDVSPGNVLIGLDGTVKLADFGIAKETRVSTLSGSMHGTVTYMAPEQCRGHAFDRRADVFSLGVILYELITGTRLFWADNDVASLHRVLSGNVARPKKLKPSIAPELDDIVMMAVAHDADKRFATARQLADAVEHYASGEGIVMGARWLARTMEEVVGPKHVPWVGSKTIVDAPRGDGSLVDIIAAVTDEPPAPTFGPNEEGVEDIAAVAVRPRRRNRRALLAVVIGLGVVLGSLATVLVMNRTEPAAEPIAAPPPPHDEARLTSPPAGASKPVPAAPDHPAPSEPPVPSPPSHTDPAPTHQQNPRPHHRPRAGSNAVVVDEHPTTETGSAVEPPPTPAAETGSGSGAPHKKKDWDPSDPLFPSGGKP
jgi:serine/threonine-protein kinase